MYLRNIQWFVLLIYSVKLYEIKTKQISISTSEITTTTIINKTLQIPKNENEEKKFTPRVAREQFNNDNSSKILCNNIHKMVDDCFGDLPPHFIEFLQTTKVSINENDILTKCLVFERGMSCFEDYMIKCLSNGSISILQNNVGGARTFFRKFCNDREFQLKYLQHKECFGHIQNDWMHCTKIFHSAVVEEIFLEATNISHKFVDLCCTRQAYEICIYNSARYKCYKESAIFVRDTVKLLTDEQLFSDCKQYEDAICMAILCSHHTYHPLYLLCIICLILCIWRNNLILWQ